MIGLQVLAALLLVAGVLALCTWLFWLVLVTLLRR